MQREDLFNFTFIKRVTNAFLKGKSSAHDYLFTLLLINNHHYIIIKYFGDLHMNPKNKKT